MAKINDSTRDRKPILFCLLTAANVVSFSFPGIFEYEKHIINLAQTSFPNSFQINI